MLVRYVILLMVHNITLPSISICTYTIYSPGDLASYNACHYILTRFILYLCFHHIFEGQ